jgi:glutathione peroxidase-family protein
MFMRKLITTIMLFMAVAAVSAQDNIYSFKVKNDKGQEVSLEQYKGKLLLVVNTATRCGFTPQYKDLEEIYEKYKDQGFEILDFPCNQFGGQAPGTIDEIKEFCSTNYHVMFTQFDKIEVNGENEIPLYTWLKANAENKNNIRWNFTKFLISADGKVLQRFESGDKMTDVEAAVAQALAPQK